MSVNDAITMSCLSRSTINRMIREGQLQSCRVGRRRLVSVASLRALITDTSST